MDLSDLIEVSAVMPALKANSKKQLLQLLAEKAAAVTGLTEREIFDTILQRERLGSTGVGNGIAIPHGKLPNLDRLYGLFAKMDKPIDFDAIDANKDGYIVRSEVAAHQERMRTQMREAGEKRFAEAFAAADLNKDGKLSRVEVDEKIPRLSKRFAWMDDNRDGFLDRAELEAGRSR